MAKWCGINGVYKDVQECKLNAALCECGNQQQPLSRIIERAVEGFFDAPRPGHQPSDLDAIIDAIRGVESGFDRDEARAILARALAAAPQAPSGQQAEPTAGQPRPFAEVVQHNQGRYFTCLAAPGVDQPAIGAKVYLAAPAGQAVGAVYSATIKTKAQMRKDIPNDQRGWYCDVAYGQTLLLRDANAADLARCNLGDSHSKNPADWLCEVFPHGCLVDRRAVASMHVEEGICVAPAALAASQAERPAE